LTRPATARVRASIFSRLQARFDLAGARVLDLFAGSGSLGLEALSRGAGAVVFVDSSRAAAQTITRNLKMLKIDSRARVITGDFRRVLSELAAASQRFELVFVDPPYRQDASAEVLQMLTELDLVVSQGWIVVRQFNRAPVLEPQGLECVSSAILGDHRITLYRRLKAPPK
jgi:16S rRNA (guanine966-N2)-methyltransferase